MTHRSGALAVDAERAVARRTPAMRFPPSLTTAATALAVGLVLTLAAPAEAATPAVSPVAAAASPAAATPAAATPVPTASGTVSWSVEPASEDGQPDGRAWMELTLDAGQSVEAYMRVTNRGSRPATFALSAADGYFTDAGRFSMLPADQPSVDAGTWITVADSVTIEPGASAVVSFVVAVPAQATPGDHLAGVAAGVYSEHDSLAVESRIGFRVMTRVTGELAPAVASTVSADYAPSWNPFLPGRLTVVVTTTNSGNTRLAAQETVAAAGPLGIASRSALPQALPELAPGDVRQTTTVIDDVWPTFATTAVVETSATGATDASEAASATARTTVATPPWSQLAVLAAAATLFVLVLRDRRRRRERWERRLEQARDEGRRAVQVGAALAVAVALGLGMPLAAASPAQAATIVDVEITPRPSASPSSTPTAAPSGAPDRAPGATLATTGTAVPLALAVGGLAIVAAGAVMGVVGARRARRRS